MAKQAKSLKPSAGAIGAVVGAVVGGVLGVVVAKKRNELKKPLAKTLPQVGKVALATVKSVANDVVEIAKQSGAKAADEGLSHLKATAQTAVLGLTSGDTASPEVAETKPTKVSRRTMKKAPSGSTRSRAQPRAAATKRASEKATPPRRAKPLRNRKRSARSAKKV